MSFFVLISVGRPELFRTDLVNNLQSVKMDISQYLQIRMLKNGLRRLTFHRKENIVENLNFEKVVDHVSKFYFSKMIKYM